MSDKIKFSESVSKAFFFLLTFLVGEEIDETYSRSWHRQHLSGR